MTEKPDRTSELLQAVLSASDEHKAQALRVLRGEVQESSSKTVIGPLLLGMSAAAKLLGVSRATLWRMLKAGTIVKIELFPGSYRVRREDLEALAAGKLGESGIKSRRGRPSKDARFQQLKSLADEGDENAASDLFKEFQYDHKAVVFTENQTSRTAPASAFAEASTFGQGVVADPSSHGSSAVASRTSGTDQQEIGS